MISSPFSIIILVALPTFSSIDELSSLNNSSLILIILLSMPSFFSSLFVYSSSIDPLTFSISSCRDFNCAWKECTSFMMFSMFSLFSPISASSLFASLLMSCMFSSMLLTPSCMAAISTLFPSDNICLRSFSTRNFFFPSFSSHGLMNSIY